MFSLGRANAFAPGDLALQEATRLLFDLVDRPSEKKLRLLAKDWSPWQAVAARLLWSYYNHQKNGVEFVDSNTNSERKEAISGPARSAVVFLHDMEPGADLLGVSDPLSEHLTDTLIAPDAPERCRLTF